MQTCPLGHAIDQRLIHVFGDGFGGSDVVGVVVLVTFVFFGAMYLIAVLPYIACTSMIEGRSLDPDPAGLPATCTGGMETSRGGSFQDCAENRVDARIANNGPATITDQADIFTCQPSKSLLQLFGRRRIFLYDEKLPSLDPKTLEGQRKEK